MSDALPEKPRESARAKLAAFDRKSRTRRSYLFAVLALAALVLLGFVAMFMLKALSDRDWFDLPKDAAWMIREGKWDELEGLLSADFRVTGHPELDRAGALARLREAVIGGHWVYTTTPAWGDGPEGHWLIFYAVRPLGDIERPATPAFVDLWLVQAQVVEEDGAWKFRRIEARRSETRPRELPSEVQEAIEGLGR